MANISKTDAMNRLRQLKRRASQLFDHGEMLTPEFDKWHRDTEVAIERVFGEDSRHIRDFTNIVYEPQHANPTEPEEIDAYEDGLERAQSILQSMIDEIRLYWVEEGDTKPPQILLGEKGQKKGRSINKRVFIVHGHDEAMKQTVARSLEKLGLDPVILHEQPSKGRTIIEKFTDYSDVSFAIVLLSSDDFAFPKSASPHRAKSRARQNVVLELGFFLGQLGRGRVLPLYRGDSDFEMPSDYSGVVYTPFDEAGNWRFKLVQELKACGFNVDANALL